MILGGRKRIIPLLNPLHFSPKFDSIYSSDIYTLDTGILSNDFRKSSDVKLPIGLAFHCALYVETLDSIFVHGGQRNDSSHSEMTLLLSVRSNVWKVLPLMESTCDRVPLFHETNCGILNDNLIVIPQIGSCTTLFDVDSLQWRTVNTDGRKSVYGGVMINGDFNNKLYFLGGREYLHRNSTKDRIVKITGQEYIKSYTAWKWTYADMGYKVNEGYL